MSKDRGPSYLPSQLKNAVAQLKNIIEFLNHQEGKKNSNPVEYLSSPIEHLASLLSPNIDLVLLEKLFTLFEQEDCSLLDVSLCSRSELNGARSGYVLERGTICIAEDFVMASSESQIAAVLLQEIFNAIEDYARRTAS